jgi:acetolactate synthase-1/2/3 large subunit
MTAATFIAQCLRQEGVTRVFGQCGHTNYALIDACHRIGIEYVSFRHEQLAAHAADAYYRVSHKLAVVNVHLSPGLTNALTGEVTAAADSTPMVIFAGNTPSYHHAREPHQGIRFHADASQGDIFRPICKRVWRVDDAKFLADVMPRALNLAQTGRPGPVLIDARWMFSQQIDVWDTLADVPSTAGLSRPTTASLTQRVCSRPLNGPSSLPAMAFCCRRRLVSCVSWPRCSVSRSPRPSWGKAFFPSVIRWRWE